MTPKRVSAAAVVSFLLACAAAVWVFQYSHRWAGLDFYQFWAGAQIARDANVENLYSMETRQAKGAEFLRRAEPPESRIRVVAQARREFEFFSTPFLYACFGVLSADYERAHFTYRLIVMVAAIAATVLLARIATMTWPQTFLILAFVLVLFEPFKSDIRVGNVNSLQLLAIAGAVSLERTASSRRGADAFAGFLYGVLVAFKPNVLLLIPALFAYRITCREYRRLATQAGGVALGAAVSVVAGALYFGSAKAWAQWFWAARDLASNAPAFAQANIAPLNMLATMFGATTAYAAALILLGVVAVSAWNYVRSEPHDNSLLIAGAAVLLALLAASLVWPHYLLLLLPLSIALMGEAGARGRQIMALAGTASLAATAWNPPTFREEARFYWLGLALILGALIWRLNERSAPTAAASAAARTSMSRRVRSVRRR